MLLCRNGCSLISLLFDIAHTVVTSLSHYFRTDSGLNSAVICCEVPADAVLWRSWVCWQPRRGIQKHTASQVWIQVLLMVLKEGLSVGKLTKSCWSLGYLVLRAEYMVPSCKASLSNKTPWLSCSASRSRGKQVSRKTHIGLAKGNYYVV